MINLKAGDPVRVSTSSRYSRYPSSPTGGWPGEVVRVARKFGLAQFETDQGTYQVEFDLATGYERGSNRVHVEPSDVVDRRVRYNEAETILKNAGLQRKSGERLSLELMEALAAVVETFGQEATR